MLVVFSLIIGEHFFGIWGALLGVPALSLTQGVFNHFRHEAMPDAPDLAAHQLRELARAVRSACLCPLRVRSY